MSTLEKPLNETDLLETFARQVADVLPATWRSELAIQSAYGLSALDALLRVVGPDGRGAVFAVEAKSTVNPRDIPLLLERIERAVARETSLGAEGAVPVVVARYLNPRARDMLEERGASYADATGNLRLTVESPAIFARTTGAAADPWRGPDRETRTLKGAPAATVVRALADFCTPLRVRELAERSGASLGSTARMVDLLEREALLQRDEKKTIVAVDWQALLRRWSEDYSFQGSNDLRAGFEPRGIDRALQRLTASSAAYAITGSLSAVRVSEIAEPRLAMIFAEDPEALAGELGLRDAGPPNVMIARPYVPALMERADEVGGLRYAALSQTAADLLSGPGRSPAEAEALLTWMNRNEPAWRH